jgi:hypothetical protein
MAELPNPIILQIAERALDVLKTIPWLRGAEFDRPIEYDNPHVPFAYVRLRAEDYAMLGTAETEVETQLLVLVVYRYEPHGDASLERQGHRLGADVRRYFMQDQDVRDPAQTGLSFQWLPRRQRIVELAERAGNTGAVVIEFALTHIEHWLDPTTQQIG